MEKVEYRLVRSDDIPFVMEGAGALVKRVIGPGGPLPRIGPLILLDHAEIPPEVGFPMHPHSGFEILTYILRGEVRHKDSEGFEAVVGQGGMQHLMTGRGMWHEEMPGKMGAEALQIWVSLPSDFRDTSPEYRSINPEEIAAIQDGSISRKVLAGRDGPLRFHREVSIEDMSLKGGVEIPLRDREASYALYLLRGDGHVSLGGSDLEAREGDILLLRGVEKPLVEPETGDLRFVLFSLSDLS